MSLMRSVLDEVHFQHFPPLPMKDFMNIVTMVPIVVCNCYSSTTGVSRPLADFFSSFTLVAYPGILRLLLVSPHLIHLALNSG